MRAVVKAHVHLPSPYKWGSYPLYGVAIVPEKNKKTCSDLAADNWQNKKKHFPRMSLHSMLFVGQKQWGQKVPVIVKNLWFLQIM